MEKVTDTRSAPFFGRVIAFVIDSIILAIIAGIGNFVISKLHFIPTQADGSYTGIWALVIGIVYFGVVLLYFENYYKNGGATPGKSAVGIKVINVSDPSKPLTTFQIFLREILGKMLLFSITLGLESLVALLGSKRALHDMIGGTKVVKFESLSSNP